MIKHLIQFLLSIFFLLLITNLFVIWITNEDISDNPENLPADWPILVLGTSSNFADGSENLFFRNRMKAVDILSGQRPNSVLILSGAKDSSYYNEPLDMKEVLFNGNSNRRNLVLDSSGNSTFESIRNFAQMGLGDSLIIITQKFHAYRAILICRYLGLESKVYTAEAVSVDITNKPVLRELLARFAAFFQFYLFKI